MARPRLAAALFVPLVFGVARAEPPPDDLEATCRKVQEVLAVVRGLPWREPVLSEVVTLGRLRELLAEEIRRTSGEEGIVREEKSLRRLGLIAPDASLLALYLDAMAPQVAGLYLPSQGRFVMVDTYRSMAGEILSHELQHAMQDQHIDLDRLDAMSEENADRATAFHAVIEGEAEFVAEQCLPRLRVILPQSPAHAGELYQMLVSSLVSAGAPDYMMEDALVSYIGCKMLVASVHERGGWEAVDRLLREPPPSTEQILHPDKRAAGEAPRDVTLPTGWEGLLGERWSAVRCNVLGELTTRAVVRGWTKEAVLGIRAAAGWGGDRYAVLEGPGGSLALLWGSEWDTPEDARECYGILRGALGADDVAGDAWAGAGPDGACALAVRGDRLYCLRGIPPERLDAVRAAFDAWLTPSPE